MKNIIRPLQLSVNHQVLEQDNKFYFIASVTLGLNLRTGKSLLEMAFQKDAFECMGKHILPDAGMPKPQAEFLASGTFYSKNSESVPAGKVKIRLGKKEKELYLFGERQWNLGLPTDPIPFSKLPLDYATAYGGNRYEKNPNGLGYESENLPQIENPNKLITSATSQADPAGFAPLDPSWSQRTRFQGSYDDNYLEKYFPGFPPDFDWRFFMAAPEDQWNNGYFVGDETFEIHNMHPESPLIKGRLPNYMARCFIEEQIVTPPGDSQSPSTNREIKITELPLNLDTVWFFPEKDLAHLIWRGVTEVSDDEAEQIKNLLVAFESRDEEPRSREYYQQALQRRLNSDDSLLNHFNTEDLIPAREQSAMDVLQDMALEDREESPFTNNIDAKIAASEALVKEKIEESSTLMEENLGNTTNNEEIEQLKLKELLNPVSPAEIELDPDVAELNKKLEEILPGITSGDPKQIRLKNFSFDKIDKIFDEINILTDKKQDVALKEIDKLQDNLQEQVKNKLENLGDMEPEQRKEIEASLEQVTQIKGSGDSSESTSIKAPLPRVDVEKISSSLEGLSPQINEGMIHIQGMLATETDPEKIKNYENIINQSQVDHTEDMKESFLQAEKEFKSIYRGSAHFQVPGLSPHSLTDAEVKAQFLKDVALSRSVADKDWACLDLSGETLDGIDLSNAYLEQVNFTGCSLRGVNFEGAILARAILDRADLTGSNLTGTNVGAVQAHRANFTDCNLNTAKLSKSNFTGSNFTRAQLNEIEPLEIIFNHCIFVEASMIEMKFIKMSLTSAKFDDSDLSRSAMIESHFDECSFINTEMPRCTWAESTIKSSKFDKANMLSNCWAATESEECKIENTSFVGTCLDKANFQNMILVNANFREVKMENGNCNSAIMENADFTDAKLRQCQFRKANLTYADFYNADIMEGSLAKAKLMNANFKNANLYAVDFLRSSMGKTDFSGANLDVTLIKDWRPS